MNRYKVTFFPHERSIEVDEGTTLAGAAQLADVYINNLCGGEGVCGECRVKILKGDARPEDVSLSFFSQEELDQGYVLACQTEIHDELEVEVPAESMLDGEQILLEGEERDDRAADRPLEPTIFPQKPLVRKIYLELSAPSLEDNITDFERLSRELRRKLGWHSYETSLACLQVLSDTLRQNDWKITATVLQDRKHYRLQTVEPLNTTSRNYGLALDVGTTTMVAQLVDLRTGKLLGTEGTHNKQAQYGEDVISRIIYACDKGGLPHLNKAVTDNINTLIEKLVKRCHISSEDITVIVAAGNTTMSHLLLNLTPCAIRLEPYVPTSDTYPLVLAGELGIHIHSQGVLYTIPSVASYVGGDIVAGLVSCGIPDQSAVRALIDIGTNGEIAIGNDEWLICCSASAGPAFEGGGTRCGMRATRGAIERVEILDGQLTYETIGNGNPLGICGSGLIDCIHELVKNGIIGSGGKFNREFKSERLMEEDGIPQYLIASQEETDSGNPIVITEADIGNLIKSKGAVFAAMKSLIEYIGLGFEQLDRLFVAGGFGSFLNIPKAVAIGLLPDIPEEKIRFIGNSSLSGARMAMLSEASFEKCINISKSMTNIELSNYQPFVDEYVAALFLPHTDRKLFPSVHY